jgi:hypothetical protein
VSDEPSGSCATELLMLINIETVRIIPIILDTFKVMGSTLVQIAHRNA